MKQIHAACAILIKDESVFFGKRNYGTYQGYWELPGGKLENKESAKEAIIRELEEEISIQVHHPIAFHQLVYPYPDYQLHMESFLVPITKENIRLRVYDESMWLPMTTDIQSMHTFPATKMIWKALQHHFKINK